MPSPRPYVLSIAGFDPSAGAGVLADIKTFEANKAYGLGVVSGLTFQNDSEFDDVKWVENDDIIRQIEVLARKMRFDIAKIGLISSPGALEQIVDYLLKIQPKIKIIWDPVLSASGGYDFKHQFDSIDFHGLCKKLYLITPNFLEVNHLMPISVNETDNAKALAQYCNVFLKGGHNEELKGRDFLYTKGNIYPFRPRVKVPAAKHGSGCVLSSAIAAYLARDFKLPKACLKAKTYTTKVLTSNSSLLGYHKI